MLCSLQTLPTGGMSSIVNTNTHTHTLGDKTQLTEALWGDGYSRFFQNKPASQHSMAENKVCLFSSVWVRDVSIPEHNNTPTTPAGLVWAVSVCTAPFSLFIFFPALMETKGKEQINRNFHRTGPSEVCLAHLSGPRRSESSRWIPTHGRPTVDEV